jgi:hypothetical protein
MVRLRDAVMAVALATGGVGCATFCDECDDFPVPGGPGGYSLMPGTYTGPPLRSSPAGDSTARAATPGQGSTPVQGSTPPPGGAPGTVPAGEAAPTPPPVPPAGAGGDQGAINGNGSPGPAVAVMDRRTTVSVTEPAPAAPPASPGGGLPVPAAGADSLPPLP